MKLKLTLYTKWPMEVEGVQPPGETSAYDHDPDCTGAVQLAHVLKVCMFRDWIEVLKEELND